MDEKHFNFLGYGNPSGAIWFLGREEGHGGVMSGEEAERNLEARARFGPIMDMYEAHLMLTENREPIDISRPRKGNCTGVWRYMAKISRAMEGAKDWEDKAKANEYVQYRLGRKNGSAFLTEISPIPSAGQTDFNGETPEAQARLQRLRKLYDQCRPKLIICYGRLGKREFARFFAAEAQAWVPYVDRVDRLGEHDIFLSPFFGNGAISHRILRNLLEKLL